MKIKFLATKDINLEPPISSKELLPDWYKETNPYINNQKSTMFVNNMLYTTATVKKCMPVFDSLTAGYLIKTWADIKVYKQDGILQYEIEEEILASHNVAQAGKHPFVLKGDDIIAKFMSIWGISTPEGYSCLFKEPSHRDNIIKIFDGVVDTDTYNMPVHLPFVLTDRNFEGVIPKGTPIAQVIPFKRVNWNSEYGELSTIKQKTLFDKVYSLDFNAYKLLFWKQKNYK
jgi:hypothetical protein